MKSKIITFVLLVSLTPFAGLFASTIDVGISGMVCPFCAQSVEKKLSKNDAVKSVDVDMETKIVSVGLKEGGSLDDKTLTKIIEDAGYKVKSIERK